MAACAVLARGRPSRRAAGRAPQDEVKVVLRAPSFGMTSDRPKPSNETRTCAYSCGHLLARGPVLPQAVAQHFAAIALGEFRDDENLLRHFWRRQIRLA